MIKVTASTLIFLKFKMTVLHTVISPTSYLLSGFSDRALKNEESPKKDTGPEPFAVELPKPPGLILPEPPSEVSLTQLMNVAGDGGSLDFRLAFFFLDLEGLDVCVFVGVVGRWCD